MRNPTLMMLLVLLTGCADASRDTTPMKSQVGQNCIVYFRRDALGMAADTPSSVTTGMHNGAEVIQAGELMEVGADWIVIGYHGRVFHIPQAAILMVEFGKNVSTRQGLSEPLPPSTEHGSEEHRHQ